MASEELKTILNAMRAAAAEAPIYEPSVAALRESMADEKQSIFTTDVPAGVTLTPVNADGVQCEWALAEDGDADVRILYAHGGGYVGGGVATHRGLVAELARVTGAAILNVDYRLAPESPFPAQYEDAMTAWHFLLENGPNGCGVPKCSFLMGDSAGGGLAIAAGMGIRDAGGVTPNGIVAFSPWTDMTNSGPAYAENAVKDPMVAKPLIDWLAGQVVPPEQAADWRISPIFGEVAGLPPMLLQVGADEVLASDSTVLAEKAVAAGVDVTLEAEPDVFHVWQGAGRSLPEAAAAIDRVGVWIRSKLS